MTDALLTPERLAEIARRSDLANPHHASTIDRADLLSHARAMQALLAEREARIASLVGEKIAYQCAVKELTATISDRSDDLNAALAERDGMVAHELLMRSKLEARVRDLDARVERLTKALRKALGDLIPEEAWDDAAAALSEARPEIAQSVELTMQKIVEEDFAPGGAFEQLQKSRPERRDPQAPKDRREAVAQYFIKDRKPRTGKDRRKQEGDMVERAGKAAMSILDGSRSYERTKAIIAAFAQAEVAAAECREREACAALADLALDVVADLEAKKLDAIDEAIDLQHRTGMGIVAREIAKRIRARALIVPQTGKENDHG